MLQSTVRRLKFRTFQFVLVAAALAVPLLAASTAEAAMRRQAISLVVPAGATESSAYTIAPEGIIRLARVDGAAHTLTMTADAGSPFGTMTLATNTTSTTGTTTISAFASIPVSGKTTITATFGSSTGSARTVRLLIYVEE